MGYILPTNKMTHKIIIIYSFFDNKLIFTLNKNNDILLKVKIWKKIKK